MYFNLFFFSSRRRHTRLQGDWSSDVCSSDLTWPKSGFTVASSVRLEVIPYFRSAPAVTFWERSKPLASGTDTFFVTAYGAISGRRGEGRPSSPCSSPSCDEIPDWDWRNSGQLTRSV